MSKLKGDTLPGVASVAIGAFFGGMTLANPEKLFLVTTAKKGVVPGPGFFPIVCSGLMILLGLALVIKGLKQNCTVTYFNMTPEIKANLKVALMTLAGLIGFLLLWKFASKLFILWVALYTAYLCVVFKRGWLFTIIFTAVMTGLIYFMFMVGFSVTFRVY